MSIEKLLEEAVYDGDLDKLEKFLELIMDEWVFFFLHESQGKNTPISSGNIERIISINKENPINLLTISNEAGNNGVIYTSSDLAVSLAEVDCKVGKMKGRKAFKMFLGIPDVDGVYIQATSCNAHIPKNEIRKLVLSCL